MIRKYYDKILLGLALAILLAVFGYAALRPDQQAEAVNIPALRPENTFAVSPLPEPDLSVTLWEEPPVQSAGPEWVFDVFTPPVIYFNPQTETFTVLSTPEPPPPPWGIELVSITEDLYRVQLVGYGGRADDPFMNLENIETGELILAREGKEYPDFDITVRSFKIEREKVQHPGGTEVFENVGHVVIYDARLDREVTLRSDVKKKEDKSTARFRATDAPDQEFRAGIGDSFTYGGYTYEVESLEPPARATVTRSGGEEQETDTKTFVASGNEGESSSQPTTGAAPQPGREAPVSNFDF